MANSKFVMKAAESGGELIETEFMSVIFQNGFPAQVGLNGCRVEDVIELAVKRLDQYQSGPLACEENDRALRHLRASMDALEERLRRRQEQGVLNTMGKHESQRTEDHVEDFSATGA